VKPAWCLACGLAISMGWVSPARAGVASRAAEETAEAVLRTFGKEVAEEGTETLARRLERLALDHGEEALAAARRTGPAGIRAIEEAAENSDEVIKFLVRHGEDALWVTAKPGRLALFTKYGEDAGAAMVRHRQIAQTLIEDFGSPAARAMKSVASRNARRLVMIAEDSQLRHLARTNEVLEVVGRYGDRAMDFIWQHKGALAVSTVLAAFLADPEPFINGTRDITKIAAENVGKPLAEVPAAIAQGVAQGTNWTPVVLAGLGVGTVLLLVMQVRRRRPSCPGPSVAA
jgi:hypothetical protein